MADNDHLKQQVEQLQKRWKTLNDKHQLMQSEYDWETRSEEKFRLQPKLDETQVEMDGVVVAIQAVQTQLKQGRLQKQRTELANLRRNKAYQKALNVARQIQAELPPNDPHIADEIHELQGLLQKGEEAKRVLALLSAYFVELAPIVSTLAQVLNPSNEHEHMQTIATVAQIFLNKQMPAEAFISFCQNLLTAPATHQYAQIASSIRKGRTVLFLGSAVPSLYTATTDDEQVLAGKLAEEIQYQNFSGSLSSIAEYYQLAAGYGRGSLVESLQKFLPQDMPTLQLYASLARIPTQVLLISAAYDNLLEKAFLAAGKPFVEIASIIIPREDYKLGYVVMKYSDREGEHLCAQEDLSTLDLLATYSVIYKLRGSCDEQRTNGHQAWRDTLTLSESNYFAFAENASKIIPDYLTRQLRDKEFLFIGFSPARWEDRLLAHALLLKRPTYSELCYTLGKSSDPLQSVFWETRNVRQSDMEFAELDRHLLEATQ